MPCRCDYMEPTPRELADIKQQRVDRLLKWDLSPVAEYVAEKNSMTTDEVDSAIAQYRQMILEGLATGTVRRPNPTEDIVLHAHILHTRDFEEFKGQVLGGFNHAPEVEYAPAREAIDMQLLNYAHYTRQSAEQLIKDPLYCSGMLKEDWGFLVAYLCSDETPEFKGDAAQAEALVFEYLRAVAEERIFTEVRRDPVMRILLEAHIIHTREFRDFKDRYLGAEFEYTPA